MGSAPEDTHGAKMMYPAAGYIWQLPAGSQVNRERELIRKRREGEREREEYSYISDDVAHLQRYLSLSKHKDEV